jgi:peptidoglycan/xylan/chitin deacetylase (PgdA/CDA1 family)
VLRWHHLAVLAGAILLGMAAGLAVYELDLVPVSGRAILAGISPRASAASAGGTPAPAVGARPGFGGWEDANQHREEPAPVAPASVSLLPPPPPLYIRTLEPDGPERPPAAVPPERRIRRVPILMYHELGDLENGLYVRVRDFEAQMRYLSESGFQPVTMKELYRHYTEGRPLPRNPVVITFDDGYRTFWNVAVPILEQYRFPATVFVITGLVGGPNYLTWEQLRQLPGMGFELGAHTVTHPDLRRLSGARLRQEIAGSRQALERETGQSVLFFCYPSGRYSAETVEAVRSAGFLAAVTIRQGPAAAEEDPLLWSRIRVDRKDSLTVFARKLADAVR